MSTVTKSKTFVPVGSTIIGFLAFPERKGDIFLPEQVDAKALLNQDETAYIKIISIGPNVNGTYYPIVPGDTVMLKGSTVELDRTDKGITMVFEAHNISAIVR
jgi:hypothetical protein